MLPPPSRRPAKRQSFCIDSLAISSHEEADAGRDTDSPYLSYLDCNSNVTLNKRIPYLEPQVKCANFIFNQHSDTHAAYPRVVQSPYTRVRSISPHSTSTPKETPAKRRRLCSTSTPPSSSDDSTSEDKMHIDSSALTEEKLSPLSTAGSAASDYEGDSTCSDSSVKRKKLRTAFTGDQLRELEKRYKTQKYLTASDRSHLAKSLGLKDQQVKTWFQNRRMKEKRQVRDEEASQGFSLPTGGVDVSQLAALGVCSPQLGTHIGSPNPINFHFSSPPSPLEPNRVPRHSSPVPSLPLFSPGIKHPVPLATELRSQELPEMYRPGLGQVHGTQSPMATDRVHGHSSAFMSVMPSRYSLGNYNTQLFNHRNQLS